MLTISGLIAWLETQDPNTTYNYGDIDDCLLARYFRAQGFRWAFVGVGRFNYSKWFLPPLFNKSYSLVMDSVAIGGQATYGAALERAKARI